MLYSSAILSNQIFGLFCVFFIGNEVQCALVMFNASICNSPEQQNVADQCFAPLVCPPSKYRTIEGTCNNPNNSWWGAANTPYVRLMKADYKDSDNNYRVSVVDGSELPGARLLSSTLLQPSGNRTDKETRMFLVFAQLLAHDVLANPQTSGSKCCSDSGDKVVSTADTCRPIVIPDTDAYYSQFGRKCQEYHQSFRLSCPSLPSSPLLPVALSSHFIDCSFLYGPTQEVAKSLRLGQGGKLRVQTTDKNRSYLPTQDISNCPFARDICYKSGDFRVNQNLDLAVMETVFMRFHNRLADMLAGLNPQWKDDDETLYEETRRLVIAAFQHISYNEFLPHFLGQEYAAQLNLVPLTAGYATGYDPNLNPSSLADFAGAAFRTLHSYIPDTIAISSDSIEIRQPINYSSTLERAGDFLQRGESYDSDLLDMTHSLQQELDQYYTLEILNHLNSFQVPLFNGSAKFGDDLAAMDVQRGRDFGLRRYNDYRQLCGLCRFSSFQDIANAFGNEPAQTLQSLYKHPDDIDYYVGSLIEATFANKSESSLRCIWGEAFRRYKFGDSFFYEFASNNGSLTQSQLKVIRGIKLSHVVCAGSDNIKNIQTSLFDLPDPTSNPDITCSSVWNDLVLSVTNDWK